MTKKEIAAAVIHALRTAEREYESQAGKHYNPARGRSQVPEDCDRAFIAYGACDALTDLVDELYPA